MRSSLAALTFATGWFVAAGITSPAPAATLNVDLEGGHAPTVGPPDGNVAGTFTGIGPGGGGTWNALTALDHGAGAGVNGTYNNQTVFDPTNAGSDNPSYVAAAGPFVYSNGGTASGISVTLANFVSADDQTPGQPGPYGGGNGNKLLDAYLVQANSNGAATVTISGLASGGKYDVYAFGSNGARRGLRSLRWVGVRPTRQPPCPRQARPRFYRGATTRSSQASSPWVETSSSRWLAIPDMAWG